MKNYIFAMLIGTVFAGNVFSQDETQDSASDAPYLLESIAPGTNNGLASVMENNCGEFLEMYIQPADLGYGMNPQSEANSGFIPAYSNNCGIVWPATYQESYSSPLSQSYAVPTPIPNPNSFGVQSGDISRPSTSYINGPLNAISNPSSPNGDQYTPFIQPNNFGNGQATGRSVSSSNPSSYKSVISEMASPAESSSVNNYALPTGGTVYSPSPIQVNNCCPPSRGFGFRGRFFRRNR